MRIRMAGLEDAAALLAIYAPYVRETAITFEYDVPSEKEFAGRIAHTLARRISGLSISPASFSICLIADSNCSPQSHLLDPNTSPVRHSE